MRSIIKTLFLLAAGLFIFAGGIAEAGQVDVKVPFPFVVDGKMLPAGQYHLQNDVSDPAILFIEGEKGVRVAMVVFTRPASGHDPAGDTPTLLFAHDETQYRLKDIWESRNEGREIAGR